MSPRIASLVAVLLFVLPGPALAQFVYLDLNGDGICTPTDTLAQGPQSIDIYFKTNAGADGTPATCSTGPEPLDMTFYEFILRAVGPGTISFGAFTNRIAGFTFNMGVATGGRDYHNGFGGDPSQVRPPGVYRVGTLDLTVSGVVMINFVASTTLDNGYFTAFGASACLGQHFDGTIRFGTEFTDACGAGPPGGLPPSNDPDPTTSFYIPQSGSVAAPAEGQSAYRFFRVCPNNDGGSSLPQSARIKIVVRNSFEQPLPNIAAGDICILLNGGTATQGFTGNGADSIIANGAFNPEPLCPDLRCIPADAPTDANGATYITFAGATPGSPGVATRDPNRKWGHYDSDLAVTVLGVRLLGCSATGAPIGSYTLRLKNLDVVGGLGMALNQGEFVTSADFSSLVQDLTAAGPTSYWKDFDSSGFVSSGDFGILAQHLGHNCGTPLSP